MASIERSDDVLGGEPRVEGTRAGALDFYELVIGCGFSPADIADQLGLSFAHADAALANFPSSFPR